MDRLGAAGAEREIVFARAALVGVALDHEGVAVVLVEPGRLLVEGRLRGRGKVGLVRVEEHAVADGLVELLHAAGAGGAVACARGAGAGREVAIGVVASAGAHGEAKRQDAGQRQQKSRSTAPMPCS